MVCVYFGVADFPGCDPTDHNRVIFEGGTANLQVKAQHSIFDGPTLGPLASQAKVW